MVVEVDRLHGRLRFVKPDGCTAIAEADEPAPLLGFAATRRQGFTIGATERLHGLGQFREPVFEYRDRDVFLAHANSDAANPFLVSTGGWGLLWDTGTAAYLRSRGRSLDYHSVAGDTVRYHVCLRRDMDAVIGGYRVLTGQALLLPKLAYGYWQSKESYARQADLIAVVDEYRRLQLPLDAIVLDYKYWGAAENFSGMTFDAATFPDPRAMLAHVHAADVHLVASIWPAFGLRLNLYREMAAKGFLLSGEHWSGGRVFDVSQPDARAIYWRHVRHGLIDIGVDGLWTDGNEPELRSTGERYGTSASYAANGRIAAGPHRFSVIGKGAIRVVFDGRVVVDGSSGEAAADGATGGVSFKGHEGDAFFTFDADLVAGRAYDFRLEQRQATPDAVSLWFEWITPTIRRREALPDRKAIRVVLPRGRDWYEFATGRRHRGGTEPLIDTPLASHPVFARTGAIVPTAPGLDRTAHSPDRLAIRVYCGHDGRLVLYDDAGDGQGHLHGEAARITLVWNDRQRTLSIGARAGRYPGMAMPLDLEVSCFDGGSEPVERSVRNEETRARSPSLEVEGFVGDAAARPRLPYRGPARMIGIAVATSLTDDRVAGCLIERRRAELGKRIARCGEGGCGGRRQRGGEPDCTPGVC